MEVYLEEVSTGKKVKGLIETITKSEISSPETKIDWQFDWQALMEIEGVFFYKLTLASSPSEIEGLLMLTLINEEMLFMNNIEIAPHNYGKDGQYAHAAGTLIAYACKKSFSMGQGYYLGFLAFESKSNLVELYQKKYGASLAVGQKMFFSPEAGKKLMTQYLSIENEE
jgi:hypothetical protein